MPDGFSITLFLAATGVAVVRTAVGPDHYVPFVALARARRWTRAWMLGVTAACGVAHVLASLALGAAVILMGSSLGVLEAIEQGRGTFAAWVLLAFGLAYALWGARRGWRTQHPHPHHAGHDSESTTVWALFLVFVLGPCEPLIPLVFLPAAEGRWALAGATAGVFGLATVTTMLLLVGAAHAGTRHIRVGFLQRWLHTVVGALLALSGAAMLVGF